MTNWNSYDRSSSWNAMKTARSAAKRSIAPLSPSFMMMNMHAPLQAGLMGMSIGLANTFRNGNQPRKSVSPFPAQQHRCCWTTCLYKHKRQEWSFLIASLFTIGHCLDHWKKEGTFCLATLVIKVTLKDKARIQKKRTSFFIHSSCHGDEVML